MSEEINKRNNELNDAALEGVSGGASEEDVQKICAYCCSKNNGSYTCTYDGEDPAALKRLLGGKGVNQSQPYSYHRCPYLKRS